MTRGAQARPHVTALPGSESAMPRRSGPSCLGKSVKKRSSYLIGPMKRKLSIGIETRTLSAFDVAPG